MAEVSAKARRRKCFYDGKERLACYIASRSDIDDVVPCLTALQIEWTKLHFLLNTLDPKLLDEALPANADAFRQLGDHLHLSEDDLARLYTVLGDQFTETLKIFRARRADFTIQLLSGSLNDYRRANRELVETILKKTPFN